MSTEELTAYMTDCRALVLDEMRRLVPQGGPLGPILYDLVFEYPLRDAKALRPALCIATCRALGGQLEGVTTSATVIELYHNAFLIHDDVEDGSEKRRDGPTLHRAHGVPVAVNVGDAMLAIALGPLLDNMRVIGLGKSLRILQLVADMARESAEGQAMELAWIREGQWVLRDADYLRMVHKKTTHYTFLTPIVIGGITAGATDSQLYQLRLFATTLGSAFQIQDDVLNLDGEESRTGKETDGDLWEGKHTPILLHAMRSCAAIERRQAKKILAKRRPPERIHGDPVAALRTLVRRLHKEGELSARGHAALCRKLNGYGDSASFKTEEDVVFLRDLIRRHGSLDYARSLADRRARRARRRIEDIERWLPASPHRDFLHGLTEFVTTRDH